MDDRVAFHNVAETPAVEGGVALHRLPADVRAALNEGARENYRRPDGVEVRFVAGGAAEVTLSCPDGECEVTPHWGPFTVRTTEYVTVGPEPTTLELDLPDRLAALDPDVETYVDPRVCRLVCHGDPLVFHGVAGDVRPPRESELPDGALLAYGTSITQGAFASRHPLAYANATARRLGLDHYNLGTGGSAFCEPEIGEYVAARDDWDAAVFELSVNMASRGFSAAEFRERATDLLATVADAHPEKPVAAVTLFPVYEELVPDRDHPGWESSAAAYRDALRGAVTDVGHDDLHVVEGPDLLDPTGLGRDLLHPSDHGMVQAAERLAARFAAWGIPDT